MAEELNNKVIGQEEAIKESLQSNSADAWWVKRPRKPIGQFIFLGPTGVGKDELAKVLACYSS
jgi:ATP-dependent Clp protease ATP-binding subunit ClpC